MIRLQIIDIGRKVSIQWVEPLYHAEKQNTAAILSVPFFITMCYDKTNYVYESGACLCQFRPKRWIF